MSLPRQRVALVTGASSGIGGACALALAERGYRVYGTSRRAATEPLDTAGSPATTISMLAMDVTDDASVEQGIATLLSREGALDIVVNNAGMGIAGPVETTSIEEAKRQFDTNFFGVLRVCRAALPAMREQHGGSIINIGSIGGLIAIPYQALYSASKFALEGLSEALRLEVAGLGIRVVLIQPGDHKTGFTANRECTQTVEGAYARPFAAALQRMAQDEQGGPGPEQVARLLLRILDQRNPRLRYTIGPSSQRAAVWLKRLLPYWVTERAMRAYYRLDG